MNMRKAISEIVAAIMVLSVAIVSFLIAYPIALNTIYAASGGVSHPRSSITSLNILGDQRTIIVSMVVIGGSVDATLQSVTAVIACQNNNIITQRILVSIPIEAGKTRELTFRIDIGSQICSGSVVRVYPIYILKDGSKVVA